MKSPKPLDRLLLGILVLLTASLGNAGELQPPLIAWRQSTPTPEPRAGYGAGVIEGKLILIGGTYWDGTKGNWTKKNFTAATHAFDPITQNWEKLPDAPVSVGYNGSAEVGGEIFVVSGVQNGIPSRDVHVLRKAGGRYEWRRGPRLPEPRVFPATVTVGRTIYVIGGNCELDTLGTTATKTLWSLDTRNESGKWKALADFPGEPRWNHKAASDGSAIYVFGGRHQNNAQAPVRLFNEVWRYDLADNCWTRFSEMPEVLQGAALVKVRERIILVGLSKTSMAFEPKANGAKFLPVAPLPRDAMITEVVWMDPLLVGASGENRIEAPRRRSAWTFIGRVTERLMPLPIKPAPFVKIEGWAKLPPGTTFSGKVSAAAVDSKGRVFVADRGPRPIKIFSPSGEFIGSMGDDVIEPSTYYDLRQDPPVPMERRQWVHGLHIDHGDNLWVTDVGRNVVMKFSREGKLLLTLGTLDQAGDTETTFSQPTGVCVAPSGDVFVSDGYGNFRIVKFTAEGRFVKAWGRAGNLPGEFHTPHGLAMDSRGRLYVCDRENDRVQVFDQDGVFIEQWPDLHSLDSLFVAPDDRIYGGGGVDNRIYRFDSHGQILEQWGDSRILGYPHNICIDRQGNMYVADVAGGRVEKFRPSVGGH